MDENRNFEGNRRSLTEKSLPCFLFIFRKFIKFSARMQKGAVQKDNSHNKHVVRKQQSILPKYLIFFGNHFNSKTNEKIKMTSSRKL